MKTLRNLSKIWALPVLFLMLGVGSANAASKRFQDAARRTGKAAVAAKKMMPQSAKTVISTAVKAIKEVASDLDSFRVTNVGNVKDRLDKLNLTTKILGNTKTIDLDLKSDEVTIDLAALVNSIIGKGGLLAAIDKETESDPDKKSTMVSFVTPENIGKVIEPLTKFKEKTIPALIKLITNDNPTGIEGYNKIIVAIDEFIGNEFLWSEDLGANAKPAEKLAEKPAAKPAGSPIRRPTHQQSEMPEELEDRGDDTTTVSADYSKSEVVKSKDIQITKSNAKIEQFKTRLEAFYAAIEAAAANPKLKTKVAALLKKQDAEIAKLKAQMKERGLKSDDLTNVDTIETMQDDATSAIGQSSFAQSRKPARKPVSRGRQALQEDFGDDEDDEDIDSSFDEEGSDDEDWS